MRIVDSMDKKFKNLSPFSHKSIFDSWYGVDWTKNKTAKGKISKVWIMKEITYGEIKKSFRAIFD